MKPVVLKRKRLDSKLAHVVLQRSFGPYAADHQPPPLKAARLDQRAKVWVRARIADDVDHYCLFTFPDRAHAATTV